MRLETIFFDMAFDKLFEAPNILFVLPFYIIPEGAQLLVVLGVGNCIGRSATMRPGACSDRVPCRGHDWRRLQFYPCPESLSLLRVP